jgi:hypothetical protein
MCNFITFCCTRQLFITTLNGPMEFGGGELCVIVLHSAGPDSYLTLHELIPWHVEDGKYVYRTSQLSNTTLIHYFHSKQEAESYIIFVFGDLPINITFEQRYVAITTSKSRIYN